MGENVGAKRATRKEEKRKREGGEYVTKDNRRKLVRENSGYIKTAGK